MCSYYHSFIPGFSEVAFPLTEYTKLKHTKLLKFNSDQLRSFENLKRCLSNAEILFTPRYDRHFIIHTDASDYAVGACLSQMDDEGKERPIAYFSSKLSDTQRNWATIKKESYAVIAALQKFDVIVFGNHIELFTDHNPLKYHVHCTPKSAKLTRWALALQRYDIAVHHRSGNENANADCLSRLLLLIRVDLFR